MLRGRSGRRRYWLATAVYFAVLVGANLAHLPDLLVQLALPLIWIFFIAWPRLHDFGRSGAWGFLAMGFGFIAGFIKGFLIAVTHSPKPPAIVQGVYSWTLLAVTIALIGWIGIRKGDPRLNRFGPPPGKLASAQAADTFD